MYFFILIRKADELGINFWLRLLALGLGTSLFLQGFYYFSVINQELPAAPALSKSEEIEKGKNDGTLTTSIRSALTQTKRLYSLSIGVKNRDGIITLTGEVPTEIDRDLAANVTKNIPGVKDVCNEIRVIANLRRPGEEAAPISSTVNVEDLEMEANLRETLQSLPALQNQPIQIKVQHRAVTLTGQVSTEHQRQLAEQTMRQAAKVTLVSNQLRLGN
ncbi:MAG: BON domain-containing protein [Acidobacteria bacterium]|nr:BON domain-containing protein [Acidobacteriota bacterium]